MERVSILTDSSACLPQESIEKYNVIVVPMKIIIDGHTYRDGVDITPGKVYDIQRSSHTMPSTSAPSPGEFLEAYQSASLKSTDLLSIAISHKLSMVFESAVQAKEMATKTIPEIRIEVFDARTAAGAHGFLVLAAARVIAAGGSMAEAIKAIENLMPKINLLATVDTLHFLAKGGRVPRAASWASSLLSIKPILEIVNGEAVPLERIRTKPKAIKRMLQIMQQRTGGKPLHVNIMHSGVPKEAAEVKQQVSLLFDCRELYITEFTPVMGVHTGPGLIGLAFYSDD